MVSWFWLTLLWLESRELKAKLINPKECLDFLARCCGEGLQKPEGGRGGQQSIPILEGSTLEEAVPH